MQFNSEANGLDLYSDARFLCGIDETTDTTSYPIKAFTRNANLGMDRANSLILKADGWSSPYNDTNQSGELIDKTQTFISGATKVSMQAAWLILARIRITDPSGSYVTLPLLDRRQLTDTRLNSTGGTPSFCYLLGNYLYFDRPTNYAGTMEVQFQQGASYFVYTDSTKTPGFVVQFHRLISLYPSLDWCDLYAPERSAALRNRIGSPPDLLNNEAGSGMEKELVDFYSRRDQDAKTTLSPIREDYGQSGLNPGGGGYPSSFNPKGF